MTIMLKFHQFYSPEKIPEGIRISLENHSSLTGNSKKKHLSQRKTFKKKTENKEFFFEIFRIFFDEGLR